MLPADVRQQGDPVVPGQVHVHEGQRVVIASQKLASLLGALRQIEPHLLPQRARGEAAHERVIVDDEDVGLLIG